MKNYLKYNITFIEAKENKMITKIFYNHLDNKKPYIR